MYIRILAGVSLGGASNESGVVNKVVNRLLSGCQQNCQRRHFGDLSGYATPCRPVIDCKMNDLE